jgi:hypothetical protein
VGALAVVLVPVASLWVGIWMVRAQQGRVVAVVAALTVVVVLGLLAGANRDSDGDRAALQLLENVWLTPPHR